MDALSALPPLVLPQTQTAAAHGGQVRASGPETEPARRRAAQDFEAVFVTQMLAPLFASLPSDGPFGGGPSEEVYRSMLIDEYGKAIARAGGFGIAEAVEREILKLQEVTS